MHRHTACLAHCVGWAPLAASRAATVGRSRPSVPTNDQQELVEGLSLLADALDDPLVDLKSVLDVLTADLVTSERVWKLL